MPEVNQNLFFVLVALSILACAIQLIALFVLMAGIRNSNRSVDDSVKELFGIMKKIEGLTAGKREQMLLEFDKIIHSLSLRLPVAVASQASDMIFDAQSKILQRLAEIDPSIKDEKNKEKMDELIKSMEGLQETLITLSSDAVRKALSEARKEISVEAEN